MSATLSHPGAPSAARPTRAMLVLTAAGATPFVAGLLIGAAGTPDATGVPLPCPFRAVTGLPCPLCGASRAFVALAHGSPDVLRYNAVIVLLAGALVLAGLLGLLLPDLGRQITGLGRRTIVTLVLAGGALSWTWALLHRGTIVG